MIDIPRVVALDFETFYTKKYSLTTMIAEQYCRDERFDPYLLSVCDGKLAWAGEPKEFNWASLEGCILVSHNRYFDSAVYFEMVRRGWAPRINYVAWHCTANLTSFLCNRRALKQAVEHLYGVKLSKQARTDAKGKSRKDFSDAEWKIICDYAKDDAVWCHRIWTDHSPKWPEQERFLSDQTIRIGHRGVQIDVKLLDQYILWVHDMKTNTEQLIPWIADSEYVDDEDTVGAGWDDFMEEGKRKPTSTKCIAEQCRRSGIPCPPVKAKEGEEAYQDWAETYSVEHKWIHALSSWRSINKLLRSFNVIKERLRDDGTLPFGLKYFGAHTGRWSGDARVNFHNFPKQPYLMNEHGLLESNDVRIGQALKEHGKTGKYPEWVKAAISPRWLIIARPGKKLIVSDLAQIEARITEWFAGNKKLLELVGQGMSIYEAFARSTGAWMQPGDLKKEDPDLYAEIKAKVLALGFGAGWKKFIVMAAQYTGKDITADDPEFITVKDPVEGTEKQVSGYGKRAREIVNDYREKAKGTVDMWKKLDGAFKSSVGEDFVMTLPSGRKMRYEQVRCSREIRPDPETGEPRSESNFTCVIGDRRVKSYGGKLFENLVQATAREVFSLALIELDPWLLFHVHDEAVLEVDATVTPATVEQIMSVTPKWLEGCPIGAEAKEVARYTK